MKLMGKKGFGKVAAAIVCIVLSLITMVAVPFGASAAMFSDVSISTPYREAIITLSTIGLLKGYEDGTFKPDNTITRAEFTVMVTRALAADELKIEGDIFTDVSNHYAKYNIRTAYDMGIINGMGDGTFKPDAPVTYEQAVKMIVCMLGYGHNAEQLGGYPNGYIGIAGQLNLTNNISMTSTEPAPRGVIAELIYNALDIKIQNVITLPDGSYSYGETTETLMEGKLKLYKIKGLVTGVADSQMDVCTEDLIDGEMAIMMHTSSKDVKDKNKVLDYTKFFKSTDEAKQYLGYDVTIYYKDNGLGDLEYIVAFDAESKRNDTISVRYDKIESCDGNVFKYEDEKGKIKSLKFESDNLNIVYNGKTVSSSLVDINGVRYTIADALVEWLSPNSDNFIYGDVKIIDSNSDNTIDIITINNYDVMIASKAPTTADYRLTDKLVSGKYIILDPNNLSYKYTVIKNDKEVEVTSIAANDIILYTKSLDEEQYKVIATSTKKSGKITGIDYAENEMSIDGTVYKMNQSLLKYYEGKNELNVGSKGTFYIDMFDNIIYCTVEETKAGTYGYLINITHSDDGDTSRASVFIPSLGSAVKTYTLDDKIKINGSAASSYESKLMEVSKQCVADHEMASSVYGSTADKIRATKYAQPVRFDISSNTIKGFVTMSKEGEINENKSVLARYLPLAKYKYTSSNNFNNEFYINSSTVIIYVPGDRNDKAEYAKMSASTLFKTGESYWIEPYDVNESKTAMLVIVYGNSSLSEITKDSAIYIASKQPAVTDVNDDKILRITMYPSTSVSAITKNSADDTEFSDIEPGDVFQFGYNNKQAMINKHILIKASDVKDKLENSDYDWTSSEFIYDYVNADGVVEMDNDTNSVYHRTYVANVLEVSTDSENKFIRVTRSDILDDGTSVTGEEERYDLANNVKVIRFNTDKNTVENTVDGTTSKLSADDLQDAKYNGRDCSKILLDVVKGEIRYIMIYN